MRNSIKTNVSLVKEVKADTKLKIVGADNILSVKDLYNNAIIMPKIGNDGNVVGKRYCMVVLNSVDDPFEIMNIQFEPNSEVGRITKMAVRILSASNNALLDKGTFKKAFPKAGNCAVKGNHYVSVFYGGLNRFEFNSGKVAGKVAYVSNREINEFDKRLKQLDLDELNILDIMAIKKDLWHLFRAWQESSIDVTKDKTKVFVKKMPEILGVIKVVNDVLSYDDNMSAVIAEIEKALKEDKPAKDIDVEFSMDVLVEEGKKVVESSLGNLALSMVQKDYDFFNEELVEVLKYGDFKAYERITKNMPENKTTITLNCFIGEVFRLIGALKSTKQSRVMPGHYALLRDAIYSYAKQLGIDRKDVIKIAIYSCFFTYREYNDKYMPISQTNTVGKLGYICDIFKAIFEATYNDTDDAEVMMYDLDEFDFTYRFVDFVDGDMYDVTDGIGFNVEDDDETVAFEMKDKTYTGTVMVIGNRVVKTVEVYDVAGINDDLTFFAFKNHADVVVDANGKKAVEIAEYAPGTGKNILSSRMLERARKASEYPMAVMLNSEGVPGLSRIKVKGEKVIIKDVLSYASKSFDVFFEDANDIKVFEKPFIFGVDNAEPYEIGNDKFSKTGMVLVFDVDMNDYFDENDIKWLDVIVNNQ